MKKIFFTLFVSLITIMTISAQSKSDRIFAKKFDTEKFPYGIGNFGYGRGGGDRYVEMRISVVGALRPTTDNPMRWSPSVVFQTNQILDRGGAGHFSVRGSFLGFGFRTGKHSLLMANSMIGYNSSGRDNNASLGGSATLLSPRFVGYLECGAMLDRHTVYLDGYLTYHLWRNRNNLWFDIGAACASNQYTGTRTSIDFTFGWGQAGIRVSGGPIIGLPNGRSEAGTSTTGFVTIGVFGSNF